MSENLTCRVSCRHPWRHIFAPCRLHVGDMSAPTFHVCLFGGLADMPTSDICQLRRIPTTGASTIWCGPCTHPRSADLERNKKVKTRWPTQLPWQLPQPLQSTPLMRPSYPCLPGYKTKRNDGLHQCGRGHSRC